MEPDWAGRGETIRGELVAADGHLGVPDRPALGVAIDDAFVAAHPSERNIAIATGGWNADTESECVLTQARRPRAAQFPPHKPL